MEAGSGEDGGVSGVEFSPPKLQFLLRELISVVMSLPLFFQKQSTPHMTLAPSCPTLPRLLQGASIGTPLLSCLPSPAFLSSGNCLFHVPFSASKPTAFWQAVVRTGPVGMLTNLKH